eukprot:scaffold4061_cov108-Cylindrotheca_fusiformis.AAC.3
MSTDPSTCKLCKHWGSDLRLIGCGCQIHAVDHATVFLYIALLRHGTIRLHETIGLQIGAGFHHQNHVCVTEAVRLRKVNAQKKSKANKKESSDENDEDIEVEARFLVYSQGRSTVSTALSDLDNTRTGRWNKEEMAFVEQLTQRFDKGELPLPEGTKLASFLSDMLLCKASRLTKKMKNAKLAVRSFERKREAVKQDFESLSDSQDRFIGSMRARIAQLELKFNLEKQWRTYFFNLCMEIECKILDARDWIASLEEMDSKASKVEEQMRAIRRKRMGLSGDSKRKHQSQQISKGVERIANADQSARQLSAAAASNPTARRSHSQDFDSNDATLKSEMNNSREERSDREADFLKFDQDGLEASHRSVPQDFLSNADELADPFLNALSTYIEGRSFPFQHADVWVPSFSSANSTEINLFHAGYVTRRDQGQDLLSDFAKFGEFSKSFTFQPNHGLPGKVYASGTPVWEVQLSNPERYNMTQPLGIQTAAAIPISTPGVGRLVVIFYSKSRLTEDHSFMNRCASDLSSYIPAPKWKLVVEIGNKQVDEPAGNNPSSGRSPPASSEDQDGDVDTDSSDDDAVHRIVSLLGDEILRGEGNASSNRDLLPHFTAIRLLLLRPPSRRTEKENDMINVLKLSFGQYSRDTQRSSSELAHLLTTEYVVLKNSIPDHSQAESQNPRWQDHGRHHSFNRRVDPSALIPPTFIPPHQQGQRSTSRLPNVIPVSQNTPNDHTSALNQDASSVDNTPANTHAILNPPDNRGKQPPRS